MDNEKFVELVFQHFDNQSVMSREDLDNIQMICEEQK